MNSDLLRFRLWNTAGRVAWAAGVSICRERGLVHRFGLWLCGRAGRLDSRADRYR